MVFIGIESKSNGLPIDGVPEKLFIGIGYNQNLNIFGERLDMLDFFYYISQFATQSWTIWDASSYYIVNKIKKKKLESIGQKPSAKKIVDIIVEEFNKPKRAEIRENCYLRQKYLVSIARLFRGIKSFEIMNAATVLQLKSAAFTAALELALDYTRKLERDNPKLIESIYVRNSNPASKLYLPLEITETIYLNGDGISGKFGPVTERFFDDAILGYMKQFEIPYKVLWSPKGPRNIPYLDDQRVVRTSTSDARIEGLLQEDADYQAYVKKYISPLRSRDEPVFDSIRRIRDTIRLDLP